MQKRIQRTIRRQSGGVSIATDVDIAIDVNTPADRPADHDPEHEEERMTNREPLTDAELDAQTGEELPDREAMSLINANVAAPVNAAVALNVLSDDATAVANAEQDAVIDQSN